MRDESDGRIQFTEKHAELLKRIFGKNMSFAHLKKMCEGNTDFYPEDELLPYVIGERGTGEDEFLADDIIWLLNVEDE